MAGAPRKLADIKRVAEHRPAVFCFSTASAGLFLADSACRVQKLFQPGGSRSVIAENRLPNDSQALEVDGGIMENLHTLR